ncbi:hypothetical protein BU24DRAFT_123101 [Aaosphaeria arxii CBS 175.79]|uniref:Uncharacterized protein n=1 Tax=Aaosphaeria arxii CBS 175.79 TaxID=1450172 RepID=A0A6A5Y3Z1_9PLEO|nr:uncharacterized protein BU24DRAFT_123101 [Aaosphaeria arxii CBS 175.79]KAF2019591.1 hypothetical protein BU24DRAFT_123101 [Aaosphaeria arxii CBS 175.79]
MVLCRLASNLTSSLSHVGRCFECPLYSRLFSLFQPSLANKHFTEDHIVVPRWSKIIIKTTHVRLVMSCLAPLAMFRKSQLPYITHMLPFRARLLPISTQPPPTDAYKYSYGVVPCRAVSCRSPVQKLAISGSMAEVLRKPRFTSGHSSLFCDGISQAELNNVMGRRKKLELVG